MRIGRILGIAFTAALIGVGFSAPASATTLTFDTATNPFSTDSLNQGWWSSNGTNFDWNDSTFTGELINEFGPDQSRSFFTFDLSSLDLQGQTIVAAAFETRYVYDSADDSETLDLFDVSTDARTLNFNEGTSAAIYDDLGTGTSYGSFVVAPAPSTQRTLGAHDTLVFTLNGAALTDIAGAAGGFFSIGAALQSATPGEAGNLDNGFSRDEALFGGAGSVSRLTLTLAPAAATPVPEPASMLLLGTGLAGAVVGRRRQR